MADYSSTKFDEKRKAIRNMKDRGKDWDYIYAYGKKNDQELQQVLDMLYEHGTMNYHISADEWKEIVTEQKEIEEKAREVVMVSSGVEQGSLEVPKHEKSSWQLYKQKLRSQNFSAEAIRELEDSTLAILRKLSQDTTETGPRKGLMIGHVQSGKTASMAGLMAMAADHGWNMFIVLSGIIDNLRVQTENRLISDLTYRPGNLSWRALNHLSNRSPRSDQTQYLSFEEGSRDRFFTVCLKNKTRLENLRKWLYKDQNKASQMKILVIDDEADQAGINTANIDSKERTAINSQIIKLVEGPEKSKAGAMNYISYTATPYANVLNEAGPGTLYPKDFIGLLPTSTEYFGPKQIFGTETSGNEGLNIIRPVDEEEVSEINGMQKDRESYHMTPGLRDSVAWFLCAVSMMRYNGYKKPISMLIHTSHLTDVHGEMANMISRWLAGKTDQEILEVCEEVYQREKSEFTVEDLYDSFTEYSVPRDKVNDYPPFEKLKSEILELKGQVSHIKLDDDDVLEYHGGIHLCIDNCKFSKTEDDNFIRLAYPDKQQLQSMEKAPAFMVVGGNTLSRGLTLEGLVSTYFLRVGRQADTLMQMGRWFGYRHGYELYPRIWMTEDTKEKFVFLATLEEELREDLKTFKEGGAPPEEYGLRIKNSPKVSWMRITGTNRSQGAVTTDWDFSGTSTQTVIFDTNKEVLKNNIRVTEDLFDSLPLPVRSPLNKSSLVWKDVSFNVLKEKFFTRYSVSKNATALNDMLVFCKWYEGVQDEIGFSGWSVVMGGTRDEEAIWNINGNKVGKIVRKVKNDKGDGSVSIGVLRAPADLYADFTEEDLEKARISSSKLPISNNEVNANRELVGLGKTPLLIIYRINKDKLFDENLKQKIIAEDLVGISIVVPGAKTGKSYAKSLIININRFVNSTGTDVEE